MAKCAFYLMQQSWAVFSHDNVSVITITNILFFQELRSWVWFRCSSPKFRSKHRVLDLSSEPVFNVPGFGQVSKLMVHCFVCLKVQGLDCMTALGFGVWVTGLTFCFQVGILCPEPIRNVRPKTEGDYFSRIEVVYVTIGSPAFFLALYLTGVHFQGALQHGGHVAEQKINRHINYTNYTNQLSFYISYFCSFQLVLGRFRSF